MGHTTLYENGTHKNVLMEDLDDDVAVQANQHLIVHGGEAIILDPGGSKAFRKVFPNTLSLIGKAKLKYIFMSHQDPDIVAAVNGWLVSTEATALVSTLWMRFVPHFGLNKLVAESMLGIPDEGMIVDVGGCPLQVIPAHYLHSCGNHQIYDPESKILYSGDLGASLGSGHIEVPDFDDHIQYMEGFHKRYMTSRKALQTWANTVRQLDIEVIAPQHGALFRGKPMVERFISWLEGLECGVDLLGESFPIPQA